MAYIPEQVVEQLVESINSDQCDAVFLSCTDMATLNLIESLERKLGKPVISTCKLQYGVLYGLLELTTS